ncbi:MAG TPA: glycosyltransferase [Anaerolineae bacterium]|nr:glycosyltransferase [Anaerolineae bacterium]
MDILNLGAGNKPVKGAMIAIVIPAKDEAETIGSLCLQGPATVIVVDDGSRDGTGEIAQDVGAIVIRHDISQGIGPSIRDGMRWAIEMSDAERIVIMDAGGSHRPWDRPARLPTDADIVIGSRFMRGSEYVGGCWWRRMASRVMAVMCNLAQSGPWLTDWTSGYRAYSRGAARAVVGYSCFAKMYAWQMEVLARLREDGFTVCEVPITYCSGRSSLRLSGMIEAVTVWLQILHHRQGAR